MAEYELFLTVNHRKLLYLSPVIKTVFFNRLVLFLKNCFGEFD